MPKLSKDERLNNENYEIWKHQAKAYLIGKDLWDYVDAKFRKTELNSEFWEHNDRILPSAGAIYFGNQLLFYLSYHF
jgi:hypothetical protein